MLKLWIRVAAVIAVGGLAQSAAAQTGHPVKGSWSGYWGPAEGNRTRILLLLDWVDNRIVGTVNPGPRATPVKRAELDVATWTLTIEADMPAASGGSAPFVLTGKVENLGSWTNRRYSGTYRHGGETGTFLVTLN